MSDRLFPTDTLTRRERVERTLRHQPVDRVALHDQMSYNPGVIAWYTGKDIRGFDYTLEDICAVIRQALDMCFPPVAPCGTQRMTSPDGFVYQCDNWTSWHVSRPFDTPEGARDWLVRCTGEVQRMPFDADKERETYRDYMTGLQRMIGGAVLCNFSFTNFCSVFNNMGLELFTFFYEDYPGVLADYLEVCTAREVRRIHAVADFELSPLILIPEDFATKQGPIFPPDFLAREHYPYITRLAAAWHQHGITVLYHSDGNYQKCIPDLAACGMDGFYCLEPAVGMDIVELKNTWPHLVWAGGVDGVDLLERGTPAEVRAEVHRHIRETNAVQTGGMFVASSSEINPPIPVENFVAMVEAVSQCGGSTIYPDISGSLSL